MIGIGALSAAVPAMAGVLTETMSIPETSTNFSAPLSFAGFGPSLGLGLLNGVTITISTDLMTTLAAENLSPYPEPMPKLVLNVTGHATSGTFTLASIAVPPFTVGTGTILGPYDGALDYGGTSGMTITQASTQTGKSVVLPADAAYSLFTDAFTVNVAIAATSTASGSGNVAEKFSTSGSATVRVDYYYGDSGPPGSDTGAPEPSALALAGVMAVGIFAVTRRGTQERARITAR